MSEDKQINLFGDGGIKENWRDEWKGMPEFEMVDNAPSQSIIVNFQTKEDREEFSKLIDQKLTYKTKSVWYPKKQDLPPKYFKYVNEKNK